MSTSRFWSPAVNGLTPYVPGEQPKIANLVKLNTNENPYGPSPKALAAMQAELADTLRLYPDPNADALKTAIADNFAAYGITPAEVFVGNGSDEVLAHAFHGLLHHERPLLHPDITYSFYPVYSTLYGVASRVIPLTDDFAIDIADYTRGDAGAIIFPNPNAPTGRLLPLDAVARIAAANPDAPVIVDEAYIDFAGEDIPTAIQLVHEYPNLLVIHTLSKSRALAGLRVGYAIGHPDLIEALERIKNSFNSYPLGRPAITGAVAAMMDQDHFNQTRRTVIASRERLCAGLDSLGFSVVPSAANFVFARHPDHDAATLAQTLRSRGIIVRHFRQARIDQHLRITIGTDTDCNTLLQALTEITNIA